jgi:glutaminase
MSWFDLFRKHPVAQRTAADAPSRRLRYGLAAAAGRGALTRADLETALDEHGLLRGDPRLVGCYRYLDALAPRAAIDVESFLAAIDAPAESLLARAFAGELAAPAFADLRQRIRRAYDDAKNLKGGAVANYIPALAEADPSAWTVAFCSVDGQTCAFGDAHAAFTIQSVHKPFSYGLALAQHGVANVHKHMGFEPSGKRFNEITLDEQGRPHNPMVNAGGIMSAALIEPGKSAPERTAGMIQLLRTLSGGVEIGMDFEAYDSEKRHADRNFALAYFMRENNAFPAGADMNEALDAYFRFCAVMMHAKGLAAIGAALANDGACVFTGAAPIPREDVARMLCIMFTCGMYDLSGEFAYSIGVPSKSGVSGALLFVVPGLGGFAAFSPPLDALGHSVRGKAFAKRMAAELELSIFVGRRSWMTPHLSVAHNAAAFDLFQWLTAARLGDVAEMRRLLARGVIVDAADYDGRTALHVAAEAGREAAVAFLLRKGAARDRRDARGETPADAARRSGEAKLALELRV